MFSTIIFDIRQICIVNAASLILDQVKPDGSDKIFSFFFILFVFNNVRLYMKSTVFKMTNFYNFIEIFKDLFITFKIIFVAVNAIKG